MDNRNRLFIKRFKKHKLGFFSLYFILFLYLISLFAGFISPHNPQTYNSKQAESPPHIIRIFDKDGNFKGYPFI